MFKTIKTVLTVGVLCFFIVSVVSAQGDDNSKATVNITFDGDANVTAVFSVPENHRVYSEYIYANFYAKHDSAPLKLVPENPPLPVEKMDPLTGEAGLYYEDGTTLVYVLLENYSQESEFSIKWQSCSEDVCFMPETLRVSLSNLKIEENIGNVVSGEDTGSLLLVPAKTINSYVSPKEFIEFLKNDAYGKDANILESAKAKGGILLLLITVFIGGILLNLTPCILPMIPVNLAILGISAYDQTDARKKMRGIVIGACFGLGIAIVFGMLGILSAATGVAFGTVQSSAVFNIVITIVFVILSLAMFGVFNIDISKFSSRFVKTGTTGKKEHGLKGRIAAAFAAGAVAALLSGACVAPVLIWTLVMAASLINQGYAAGAFLPFVLGVGMGVPWVFIGGGIAWLPKPGRWMNAVKYIFAVVFLMFALNYAITAWNIIKARGDSTTDLYAVKESGENSEKIEWIFSMEDALRNSAETGKPVLVYLTADWCSACKTMERHTLSDQAVIEAVGDFIPVKVDCTDYSSEYVKQVMKQLGAVGLPFAAVLTKRVQSKIVVKK